MKIDHLLLVFVPLLSCAPAHAGGDARNGKLLYAQQCSACHSLDANLAGPAHRGVFGRKAGTVAGFDYSPALRNSRVIWNEDSLNKWLAGPEQFIPGQLMWYSVSDAQERADLIEYLKSESKR